MESHFRKETTPTFFVSKTLKLLLTPNRGVGGKKFMIMKKLFVFATLCFGMFTVANAQEDYAPEKGDFAVEFGFTPFNTLDGESFRLNEGMLKVRYFISDKDALRLKIGLGINNKTNTIDNSFDPVDKTVPYTISESTTKTKNKATDFSFMLGYERHLFTKGRFDVYAGLELGYGMSKYSGSVSTEGTRNNYDVDGKLTDYTKQDDNRDYTNISTDGRFTSQNYFAGNLFAGVDVYVWKNLYLGAECGLAFKTGKSPNTYFCDNNFSAAYKANGELTGSRTYTYDGETFTSVTTTVAGGTTTTTTVNTPKISDETSETSFKFFVEPAIRIGWKF